MSNNTENNSEDLSTAPAPAPVPAPASVLVPASTTEGARKMYLVCCETRIVLAGLATESEMKKEHPTLEEVRMVVYWPASNRGLLGLASSGPLDGARITPAAPSWTITSRVEGYGECSEESTRRFREEPWS